jgi:hypothetical protein
MKSPRRVNTAQPIVFRGTVLDARQLAKIKRLVEVGRGRTRQELAREVCRAFGWRRPNGAWAIRGARQLLVRLEKAGVIHLPAPRRAQGRPRREVVEEAVALLRPTGALASAESSARRGLTLHVRPIRVEELLGWRAHMERFHSLGDAALVGESSSTVSSSPC